VTTADQDSPRHDAEVDATPVPFWQLEFALAAEDLEAIETLLWDRAALSVSAVPDADAPDIFEPDPGATPLWQTLRLQALFASAEEASAAASAVRAALPLPVEIEQRRVADEDWLDAWRQHVKPVCLGGRLWICPTGERTDEMGEHVVLLDAGMAFGTGAHATTALCLEWLAGQPLHDARVVDFGCGSGILGIAALVLGARRVLAVDHDPQAHRATAENAVNNGVGARLQLVDAAALPAGEADVLLANILAGTLIELAPLLTACVAEGGSIALSGVLAHQAAGVMAAYPAFEFGPAMQREDWVCLPGRRRPLPGAASSAPVVPGAPSIAPVDVQ
jgi:ribosomal protein L11 methyltransferase